MLRAAFGSRVPVAAMHAQVTRTLTLTLNLNPNPHPHPHPHPNFAAQTDEEGEPVMRLSCNIASADGSYEALSVPNPNPIPNTNPYPYPNPNANPNPTRR